MSAQDRAETGGRDERDPRARPSMLDSLTAEQRQLAYDQARRCGADSQQLQPLDDAALLRAAAADGIALPPCPHRRQVLFEVLRRRTEQNGIGCCHGVLEVLPDGFGFVRSPAHDYAAGPDDVYVSPGQVHRLGLRSGHLVSGPVRPPRRGESYLALLRVETVNGGTVDDLALRAPFDQRVPVLPTERLRLESDPAAAFVRGIELLTPCGHGQRVLVQAPPRCGRTRLLTRIAAAAEQANPDLQLVVCLLDQRPEDVTEVRRGGGETARREVVATSFDEPAVRHVMLADLALQRCERAVEAGGNVLLVVDSLTALARACQRENAPSGRVLVPGLEPPALLRGKKLFAAARNLEGGGSLTVVATVQVGTGSEIDAAIAAEFAGKGNAELVLDRDLAALHELAPIDLDRTGTRHEDLLLSPAARAGLLALRGQLRSLSPLQRQQRLAELLRQYAHNADLLRAMTPN